MDDYKRKRISKNIVKGVIYGVILDFVTYIFFALFGFDKEKEINPDIIPAMAASVVSGGLSGYVKEFLNDYQSAAVTTVIFNYTDITVDNLIFNKNKELDSKMIVSDVLIAEILLHLIKEHQKIKKENNSNSLFNSLNLPEIEDNNLFIIIFVSILSEIISQFFENILNNKEDVVFD